MKIFERMAQQILEEGLSPKRSKLWEDVELNEASMKQITDWLKSKLGKVEVFFKRLGNKVFGFYKKGKETGVINRSGKVAAKWASTRSNKMTFIINPAVFGASPKTESKKVNEARTATEIKKLAMAHREHAASRLSTVEEPPEDALQDVNTADVNYDDLATILGDMAFSLKFRKDYKQDVPSMFLMGPPGSGKTTVVKKFAEANGFKTCGVEVASQYQEVFGGFPVVERFFKPGVAEKMAPEEMAKLGDEFKDVCVKLVQTNILPPSKDTGKWLLFLDEFNRDSAKMGSVMNLALTGNIGTTYFLPLQTIVIAAGNVGEDQDGVPVAEIDAATWDRFNIKRRLTYDWISWMTYGEHEHADTEMGGIPSIIKIFVARQTEEKGDQWSIDLKQFNPEAKARLTPRTISKLVREMHLAARKDWESDKLVGSHDKKYYEDGFKKEGFPNAAAYYLHVNQLAPRYFKNQCINVFGPQAGDIVVDMFTKFQKTKEEASLISVDDVLLKWSVVRDQKKGSIPGKIKNEFAMKLPDALSKMGNAKAVAKALKDAKIDLSEYGIESGDEHVWVGVNINNFIVDSKLGLDLATGVAKTLSELRKPKQEGEEGKKAKKGETTEGPVMNEFMDQVLAYLIGNSKIFGEAWKTVADAVDDTKSPAAKKAAKFARQGMLITGNHAPSYVTKELSGTDLYNYLYVTNVQMQTPQEVSQLPVVRKAEAKLKEKVSAKTKKAGDKYADIPESVEIENALKDLLRRMV